MITKVELDGFKTFQGFTLSLGPLQVIVGANGAGKSNLFDALKLLGRLADLDLRTSFQDMRGEAGELFTIRPDGESADHMSLAVEMLVDRHIQDDWGAQEELKFPRIRYELEVARRKDAQGLERLYVEHELLASIPRHKDEWARHYGLKTGGGWIPSMTGGRSSPFISTSLETGKPTLSLHQDGSGGRRSVVAEQAERTVLSGIQNTEFPHALAVAQEMRGWRFLQFNPEVLRQPSPMTAPNKLAGDGGYLPNVLARMKAADPMLMADVSRDLANRVPGILSVEVEEDHHLDRFVIWVRTEDGRRFSSGVLSDGTLRMLALITIKNDPEYEGLLCFEEPENGVHPFRLESITRLLQDIATDFSEGNQGGWPLRQVLCNTHSPALINHSDIPPHVLFAHMAKRVDPSANGQPQNITRIVPVTIRPPLFSLTQEEQSFTLSEVRAYLEGVETVEAWDNLAKETNVEDRLE